MGDLVKEVKVEISGETAEKIVRAHVEKIMNGEGYTINYEMKQDGEYWPSMLYRGKVKETDTQQLPEDDDDAQDHRPG